MAFLLFSLRFSSFLLPTITVLSLRRSVCLAKGGGERGTRKRGAPFHPVTASAMASPPPHTMRQRIIQYNRARAIEKLHLTLGCSGAPRG